MLKTIQTQQTGAFLWKDISGPTLEELKETAIQLNIPASAVIDCLEPEHLPKHELLDHFTFLIVRFYDENSPVTADTVQLLSRKIALFFNAENLLTIHRAETGILNQAEERCLQHHAFASPFACACEIVRKSIESFEPNLLKIDKEIDFYETRIFLRKRTPDLLKNLYLMKRKIYITKRLVLLSKSVVEQLGSMQPKNESMQELRDAYVKMENKVDEMQDNISSLLNIYLSISSQKTNEVMRILTAFSAFFLPLTFIVGVYGMNFQYMPELTWKYGYPGALGLMFVLTVVIYFWFKRKGWMR